MDNPQNNSSSEEKEWKKDHSKHNYKEIWEELATQQQRCCDLDIKTNQRILDERKTNEMTHVLIFERIKKLEEFNDEDVKVSKNRLDNVEVRLTEIVAATNDHGSTCQRVERDNSRHQKWLEGLEERVQKMEYSVKNLAKAGFFTNLAGQETLSMVRELQPKVSLLEANQSKTSTTTPPEVQQT